MKDFLLIPVPVLRCRTQVGTGSLQPSRLEPSSAQHMTLIFSFFEDQFGLSVFMGPVLWIRIRRISVFGPSGSVSVIFCTNPYLDPDPDLDPDPFKANKVRKTLVSAIL